MLYAAELTRKGQRGLEGEYQAAITRMGRVTLGAFKTTPGGIVEGESALTPARAFWITDRRGFHSDLLARPKGGRRRS